MRKLPDNENMYTYSEASEMIGKSRSYISLFLRRYKGDIPENAIIETNWSKYITDSGLAWLNKERAKKGRNSHPRDKNKQVFLSMSEKLNAVDVYVVRDVEKGIIVTDNANELIAKQHTNR